MSIKKLIIVNGTMGVGKTTVCSILNKELEPSVWLDGDWCWHMNPWVVNEINKKMVESNITFLLNNFITNPNYQYIIFNWVLHKESIWESLEKKLNTTRCSIYRFTLLCDETELKERMINDNRGSSVIEKSAHNYSSFANQNTIKIDVTRKSAFEAAHEVLNKLQ